MINGLYRRPGYRGAGLGALQLLINKSAFNVGEAPNYSIINAHANQPVLWSSTRAGASTGENLSNYGQVTDAQGTLNGPGGPWTDTQAGQWTKSATVDGESSTVAFAVNPLVIPPATGGAIVQFGLPARPAPGMHAAVETIDVLGYQFPKIPFYLAVAGLAFLLLRKK